MHFSSIFIFVSTSFLVTMSLTEARPGAPRWWSLAMASTEAITCSRIPGLVPKQLRYCSRHSELMPSIAHGTKLGIEQCKYQFKQRRWNCNTLPIRRARPTRKRSVFGHVLERASREAAFVHAIASAGVVHTVTRACADGNLMSCGCDTRPAVRDDSLWHSGERDWQWGGCNDDVSFGMEVSREFADARDQGRDARALMNRHNNEAGRQVILSKMRHKCKCHGPSGSCEMKTCWRALPEFSDVGAELKQLYIQASEMKTERHREARGWVESLLPRYSFFDPPGIKDLIFFDNSPNFCERNEKLGIEGTTGRVCDATSSGVNGCDLLCCGRGYVTKRRVKVEQCNCVFHWCCNVTCQECTIKYEEHTCR